MRQPVPRAHLTTGRSFLLQLRSFARQSKGSAIRQKADKSRLSSLDREHQKTKRLAVDALETRNEWSTTRDPGATDAAEKYAKAVSRRSQFELPEAPSGVRKRSLAQLGGGENRSSSSSSSSSVLTTAQSGRAPSQRSVGDITDAEIRGIFPADVLSSPYPAASRLVKRPHLWMDSCMPGESAEDEHGDDSDSRLKEIAECEAELQRLGAGGGATTTTGSDHTETNDVDLAYTDLIDGDDDALVDQASSTSSRSAAKSDYNTREQQEIVVPKLADVGKFERFSRDDLLELLPEGLGGELSRDLILIPSQTKDVGFMLRKPTVEILTQMAYLQKDAEQVFDKNSGTGGPPQDSTLDGVFDVRSKNYGKRNFLSPPHRNRAALISSRAGWLLEGKKGVGKSAVLNHVVAWARRNGWLVVFEPFAANYAKEISDIARSSNSGIYVQNSHARRFLERTLLKNAEFFEQIPVDLAVYGRACVDGEPSGKVHQVYDELIQKAVDKELGASTAGEDHANTSSSSSTVERNRERLRCFEKYRRRVVLPSLKAQLPEPENLYQIVQFGLDHETWATQAVAELMRQLQVQTKFPVLVCVDEWNECFPVSDFVSMRYDGTRFGGYIPAYHLSMCRRFCDFDGHRFKRGLKLYSTSWYRMNRRDYRPELLGVKPESIKQVREFSPFEFANYCAYFRLQNITYNFPREKLEQFWMLTQGNGWQARRTLSMLY
ncbi:unnamed protein product [Amoebophrya sp. A120]|nr:unnamed protein product [Amoebophrya sp. A120]|eukprot:GSA120T00001590001.1